MFNFISTLPACLVLSFCPYIYFHWSLLLKQIKFLLSDFRLKVISMGHSLFRKLFFDDSDKDEIIKKVVMDSTSQCKHHRYIRRNHLVGHERLYLDYFADSPIYPEKLFWKRFWMSRSLFMCI